MFSVRCQHGRPIRVSHHPLHARRPRVLHDDRQTMIEYLDPATVHLWFAREPSEPDPDLAAACRDVMSEDERRRESDFVFEKDRRLYRLARVLLRTALSRCAPVEPRAWVFEKNPHGQPYVVSPPGSTLRFSVSHTPGMAMVLVGTARELGVDVEDASRFTTTPPPTAVLGPSELADLQATPPERYGRRFLEYWTLKE